MSDAPLIRGLQVVCYRIPTEVPEADGTFQWNATTMVLVRVHAGDACGLGYSYTAPAAAQIIEDALSPSVIGRSACDVTACWIAMLALLDLLGATRDSVTVYGQLLQGAGREATHLAEVVWRAMSNAPK